MSTCSIYFYKTKITPDRNALVDDLETYLGTLTATKSYADFQYQKMGVALTVKIDCPQDYQDGDLGNYCKIVQDNKNWYFFISQVKPLGQNTLEVNLVIDSINTFVLGTDYVISNNSTILRQHKNRYKKVTGSWSTGYSMVKNVDRESEGLGGLVKQRTNKEKIYTTEDNNTWLNKKWYLAFHNDTENGYSCRLYPEADADVPLYYQSGTNYYTVPTSGATYFFTRPDNGNFKLELDGTLYNMDDISLLWYYVGITYVSSSSKYTVVIGNEAGVLHTYTYTTIKIYANYYRTDGTAHTSGASVRFIAGLDRSNISTTGGLHYFTTVDTLDRKDSAFINIIECPYCPVLMTWDSNNQVEENGWFSIDKDNNCIDFAVNNIDFGLTLTDDITSKFTATISAFASQDEFKTCARRSADDPKMLHSEITEFKYGYGDESQTILLENVRASANDISIKAHIKYKQTSQPDSAKVFDISIDTTTDDDMYYHIEDYDNIIFSNRNDEVPLINDNYIYYMRNGYNLDKQSNNRQKVATYVGLGLNAVQMFVNPKGNAMLGAGNIITGAKNTISGIISAIQNTSMLDANLQYKVNEAKAQANSIRNINNIDLVDYYDGNYLYNYIYEPTTKQKENINDLFYYCGYAVNKRDSINLSKINTRMWFDYIQADIICNTGVNAYETYLADIKARYSAGVTRYHKNTINSVATWDWNREYENWESSFN